MHASVHGRVCLYMRSVWVCARVCVCKRERQRVLASDEEDKNRFIFFHPQLKRKETGRDRKFRNICSKVKSPNSSQTSKQGQFKNITKIADYTSLTT